MRSVAALYDIHGNLPALEAVLADLAADPPESVVIGGDVAAGPMPAEVLARLRELPWPAHWLRGNADRIVVQGFDGTIPMEIADHPLYRGDAWAAARLQRADRDFLDTLAPLVVLDVAGFGEVLFCHGTPRSDEERVTVVTPPSRVAQILDASGARTLVCGHTHRQFDHRSGERRLLNAGSIGRPYERRSGAYWLRLEAGEARLQRTRYDTAGADAHFRVLGYPAAELVFADVDPDAVAERYERASGDPLAPESLIPASENPLAGDHLRPVARTTATDGRHRRPRQTATTDDRERPRIIDDL